MRVSEGDERPSSLNEVPSRVEESTSRLGGKREEGKVLMENLF